MRISRLSFRRQQRPQRLQQFAHALWRAQVAVLQVDQVQRDQQVGNQRDQERLLQLKSIEAFALYPGRGCAGLRQNDQHRFAAGDAGFNLAKPLCAAADILVVDPNAQARLAQPFDDGLDDGVVTVAMADEDG